MLFCCYEALPPAVYRERVNVLTQMALQLLFDVYPSDIQLIVSKYIRDEES